MKNTSKLIGAGVIAISSLASTGAFAAGFQISETSVAGLGRAFAGNGIAGDTISDMFANPAGLMLRSGSELELGLHILSTSADFENRGSTQRLATPLGFLTVPSRGPGSDGGGTSAIPNLYYATDLSNGMRFGLSVTSPFGLVTEYDDDWVGRYQAIKSELITVDINPNIAYQVNDNVSVGGGISVLLADTTLTRAQFTGPTTPDAAASITGDDVAIGFNLGLMVGDEDGRFGIGYRSEVDVEAEGDLRIPLAGVSAGAAADVTLPQTLYLSGFKKVSDKVDLLGTIRWTGWSSFEELRVRFDNGLPDAVTPENWDDSVAVSLGLNYHLDDRWTLRGGLAVDDSPVDDEFRTARIPDTDRTWVSFGGSYQASERTRIDFGYAHIFTDDVPLNESVNLVSTMPGAAVDNVRGEYTDTDANLLSVSINIALGK
ncbi:MAG: outer membrane protein transport protein [Pseudomonadota bacterium]